jgi:hypothetical protein
MIKLSTILISKNKIQLKKSDAIRASFYQNNDLMQFINIQQVQQNKQICIVCNPRLITLRYSTPITNWSTDKEILVVMNYSSLI